MSGYLRCSRRQKTVEGSNGKHGRALFFLNLFVLRRVEGPHHGGPTQALARRASLRSVRPGNRRDAADELFNGRRRHRARQCRLLPGWPIAPLCYPHSYNGEAIVVLPLLCDSIESQLVVIKRRHFANDHRIPESPWSYDLTPQQNDARDVDILVVEGFIAPPHGRARWLS